LFLDPNLSEAGELPVESYKTRAMEKLRIGSRVALVRYAIERGWLSSADDHPDPAA
jgi:hypothetical protein